MQTLKALHIIAMVSWFAGLFYLPRLFVYHAMTEDQVGRDRFAVMERKLYRGIMTPAMLATIAFGLAMLLPHWSLYRQQIWVHVKLTLVMLLLAYHLLCGRIRIDLAAGRCQHGHVFFRWFNEIPVLFLVAIVMLVELKPF